MRGIVFALAFLVSAPVWAAPEKAPRARELWSLAFAGAVPEAVFFDASSSSLLVSLQEGEGARLDRVSLTGKLEKQAFARGKGRAGALRAFAGKIYWIVGDGVQVVDASGSVTSLGQIPQELGEARDLAVSKSGAVYLGMSSGALYRLENQNGAVLRRGAPITGLFLLGDTLYILRGGRLHLFQENVPTFAPAGLRFCAGTCAGLERSSSGAWLTSLDGSVMERSAPTRRVLVRTDKRLGRLAYVYRKEPRDDFFVLPVLEDHSIRAYLMPGSPAARAASSP